MSYATLKPWIQKFVDAYVADAHEQNATAAFRAVKPSSKRPNEAARRLMTRPEVQDAIQERLTRRREATELDEKWVLDRLRSVAERCMQTEAVVDRSGKPTGEYTFDSAGANRALELIGRHFAMFTENFKIKHTSNAQHEMSDDELMALVRSGLDAGSSATH